MFVMFNVGVVGGALSWLLFQPHTRSIGASGGCYALLGMHIADLIVNWKQKKFRFMLVCFLVGIMISEAFGYMESTPEARMLIAHSIHFGGLIAGLLIGISCDRNIDGSMSTRIVQRVAIVISVL